MLRVIGFCLIVLSVFGLSTVFINQSIPAWKTNTKNILSQTEIAGTVPQNWEILSQKSQQELPWFYPFSSVKKIIKEAETLVKNTHNFKESFSLDFDFQSGEIDPGKFNELFVFLNDSQESLNLIQKKIDRLPVFLLSEAEQNNLNQKKVVLKETLNYLEDLNRFEEILAKYIKEESRVLILLQNQNEPRSTGGFAGSLIMFDFSDQKITWDFLDIYALDRLVPIDSQLDAPEFFHNLSTKISLRDANFWPNFATSSQEYQRLFEASGQKSPDTIIAINLNSVKEILKLTGAVEIPKWDLTLNSHNFDLVLQFIIEAKLMGRFQVKEPIEIFAKTLLSPERLKQITLEDWAAFDLESFKKQKNILAYSASPELQDLFQKWNIDGLVKPRLDADNFLHVDFISIGANKSDKFVWTKIGHNSEIDQNGTVLNTLKIKRTHALKANEIQDLLGTNNLSPNVKDQLTPDILWKLGAGQNRTVMRAFVPRSASLFESYSPTGPINEKISDDKQFKIWEIPINVLPGESGEITLTYMTKASRGSVGWRPYYFQLMGTPAQNKASFLKTISTKNGGAFTAVTQNIGRPTQLINQNYRTVIEF